MKKLALTSLIVLIAIKSVSACTYYGGNEEAALFRIDRIVFSVIVFLFLGNVFLFFLRKQRDHIFLILIVGAAVLMSFLNVFGIVLENCDLLGGALKMELIAFSVISIFHIGLWATKTRFEIIKQELPSIKP